MARTILPRRPRDLPALLDRFFEEPLVPRMDWPEHVLEGIPLDVVEEDDTLVVRAAVPGLKREDLHVDVRGDELRIWGERKEETEHEEEDTYLREHRYGRIERRLLLPSDVDTDAAKAAFEDGILTLRLPKVEDGAHREIEIEAKT
jgi:HSP20 family protein